ncbi:MAG TPA: hypothetical protein VMY38_08795 [Gemmatimonadaceae bacterium]|nr:hypothetical protein [Gemmatimonadaceae bacterium]
MPTKIPSTPWQLTGNHWLALPCIHPADGSLHAVGLLHRAARGAIEFAGGRDFVDGKAEPLAKPVIRVGGVERELGAMGMAWERISTWIPTFNCVAGDLAVRGIIFAPYGRDADVAGAVYAITIVNRGKSPVTLTLGLEGVLGHRQQRIRSARAFDDAHRITVGERGVIVLDGAAIPAHAALAVAGDGDCHVEVSEGDEPRWSLTREIVVEPGGHVEDAFYIGAGPERDGAEATVAVMRRRGWKELLRITTDTLRSFEQSIGNDALDRLLNRNMLLSYFYAVGRALDDAHFYLVRTRVPWNAHGLTVNDWEALTWTIPAVQLADSELARELILRMCELHGYAPGTGVHYLDGTLFQAGFSLEGASAYAIAVERYISQTGDDQIVEEAAVADALYQSHEDIEARRDKRWPLYSTEVTPGGDPVRQPYGAHANAVVAQAMDMFKRTLDEKTAEKVEDAEAIRAALRRKFATSDDAGTAVLHAAIDLDGASSSADDPVASLYWLPFYDSIRRDDSVYRRTVRPFDALKPAELSVYCARLIGPGAGEALNWLRRAPLDNGFAAEMVTTEGAATANGGDATLAGLLAYSVWYAAHVLGVRA